ncbi:MAG: hypothetical protein AAFQ45_00310 [Pseudomonadota bacterium]
MNRAPTILLTAFGPFPGVSQNVSSDVVKRTMQHFADRGTSELNVTATLLPTEWRAATTTLAGALEAARPDAYVGFGVSRKACGFVVETLARNAAASVDANKQMPPQSQILSRGVRYQTATIPTRRIVSELRALNLPARRSLNAGSYLCNTVLYLGLAHANGSAVRGGCGFVHLPTQLAGHETDAKTPIAGVRMSLDDAVAGAVRLIDLLADDLGVNRAGT